MSYGEIGLSLNEFLAPRWQKVNRRWHYFLSLPRGQNYIMLSVPSFFFSFFLFDRHYQYLLAAGYRKHDYRAECSS